MRRGEAKLKQLSRTPRDVALLMLDIDHFKRINDRLGPRTNPTEAAGIAERIRLAVEAASITVRIGAQQLQDAAWRGAWIWARHP